MYNFKDVEEVSVIKKLVSVTCDECHTNIVSPKDVSAGRCVVDGVSINIDGTGYGELRDGASMVRIELCKVCYFRFMKQFPGVWEKIRIIDESDAFGFSHYAPD